MTGPKRAWHWMRLRVLLLVFVLWECARAGFWRPARVIAALRVWALFRQCDAVAQATVGPLLKEHAVPPPQARRLLRYARNCVGLARATPLPPAAELGPDGQDACAAAYGLCIPLYDDLLDWPDEQDARRWAEQCEVWLVEHAPSATGMPGEPLLHAVWAAVTAPMTPERRQIFAETLHLLHTAQVAAMVERQPDTPEAELEAVSRRKGALSFVLLIAGCLEARPDMASALYDCGALAQLMDDLDDLDEDRRLGSRTFTSLLAERRQAVPYMRAQLDRVLAPVEAGFGVGPSRIFTTMLRLNLVIKLAHHRLRRELVGNKALAPLAPAFYSRGVYERGEVHRTSHIPIGRREQGSD